MMKKIFTSKNIFLAAVISIAAAFFLLNYFTPYLADDYYLLSHTIRGTDRKITNINDFLLSVRNFYFDWGGRVEGYLFTTLFTYVPPIVVDCMNTICYIAVTFLIYLICKGNHKNSLSLYLSIHVLLWICVPDYGQVMFWLCGAANYLWTSFFIILLLYVFRRYFLSKGTLFSSPIYAILTFLLGFIAGFAMENMSAGMLVILTLYLFYFYLAKWKVQLPIITSYLGSILGFACLVFSPGNHARSEYGIQLSIVFKFFIISYYWVTFVGILCILWLALNRIAKKKLADAYRPILAESLIYLCGAISAAYCMLAAPSSPERTWYIVCVYLLISLSFFYSALETYHSAFLRGTIQMITAGSMVLLFVSMADTMLYSIEISIQTKAREAYILEQKELGNLEIDTPIITHKYPLRAKHDALTGLSDITTDADYWINQAMANYYGVNSITGTEP